MIVGLNLSSDKVRNYVEITMSLKECKKKKKKKNKYKKKGNLNLGYKEELLFEKSKESEKLKEMYKGKRVGKNRKRSYKSIKISTW